MVISDYMSPGSSHFLEGWRENEYKAMVETIEANFNYEYISFSEHRTRGYVSMYTRAALRIIDKK